jgi:hypothetical protein
MWIHRVVNRDSRVKAIDFTLAMRPGGALPARNHDGGYG